MTSYSTPIRDLSQATPDVGAPIPSSTSLKAELPNYLDSTMITCWRGCQRKFYNEFVLGLRPTGLSVDLHAGGCFALAVETVQRKMWEENLSFDTALLYAEAAFQVAWGDFEIPEFKKTSKTRDRMWEAVLDYFREYPPLTDPCPPYFDASGKPTFEYTFAIPLTKTHSGREFPMHPITGDPFLWTGRFDMLGNYMGRPTPRDDKTGGSIGSEWTSLWKLRNQFMGYVWACRECGLDTEGVLVRGMGILKTEFKHAEVYQPFSQDLLDRWHEQLCNDIWEIVYSWKTEAWQYDFADNCVTFFKPCMFMDACTSSNPDAWLSQLEVRRWNPLLKNPVGATDPAKEHAL